MLSKKTKTPLLTLFAAILVATCSQAVASLEIKKFQPHEINNGVNKILKKIKMLGNKIGRTSYLIDKTKKQNHLQSIPEIPLNGLRITAFSKQKIQTVPQNISGCWEDKKTLLIKNHSHLNPGYVYCDINPLKYFKQASLGSLLFIDSYGRIFSKKVSAVERKKLKSYFELFPKNKLKKLSQQPFTRNEYKKIYKNFKKKISHDKNKAFYQRFIAPKGQLLNKQLQKVINFDLA
ncbi:hypothetical protein KAH94_04170 [bacterium]|nr:hypothetical protein [bacterium]